MTESERAGTEPKRDVRREVMVSVLSLIRIYRQLTPAATISYRPKSCQKMRSNVHPSQAGSKTELLRDLKWREKDFEV